MIPAMSTSSPTVDGEVSAQRLRMHQGRRVVVAAVVVAAVPALLLADLGYVTWRGYSTSSDVPAVLAGVCGAALTIVLALVMSRRGRLALAEWAPVACLAVVAAGVAWLGLELAAARLFGSELLYHRHTPGLEVTIPTSSDVMPGIGGESHVRINELGLRGDPYPGGDDTARVLCVGGSTTLCLVLDQAETWPALLQQALDRPDRRVYVANAGKNGYGTWQHVRFLESRSLIERFDTVLFLVGINDFMRAIKDRPLVVPFGVRPLYERSAVFSLLHNAYQARREMREHRNEVNAIAELPLRCANRARTPIRDDLPDLGWALEQFADNLATMIDACGRYGVRPVFATQPVLYRHDLGEVGRSRLWLGATADGRMLSVAALTDGLALFNATTRRVCAERGVQCIDLSELDGRLDCFIDSCHYSELGAREVARILARGLGPAD